MPVPCGVQGSGPTLVLPVLSGTRVLLRSMYRLSLERILTPKSLSSKSEVLLMSCPPRIQALPSFFLLCVLLASCAKPPSRIEAAKVSSVAYSKMNCSELLMERDAEISNLETQSGKQINKRSWDIALNLLILPGLSSIKDDSSEAIAQSKGKIIAIQEQIDSRCIKDDAEDVIEDEKIIQDKISNFFYDDPDSDVNRAIVSLKKLYFGEDDSP